VRLQALYPGNNATQIGNQQTVVLANWAALQERSAQRREELNASCDLHRFLAQVRPIVLGCRKDVCKLSCQSVDGSLNGETCIGYEGNRLDSQSESESLMDVARILLMSKACNIGLTGNSTPLQSSTAS